MKTNFKNISKATIAIVVIALAFTACKKDSNNSVSPLSATKQTASVPSYTNRLLYGNWGSPTPPPGDYKTRYFNLATGAQDSTGTSGPYHLTFTSTNNLLMKPYGPTDTLRYLNTSNYSTLKLADYYSATVVSRSVGLGLNSTTDSLNTTKAANGWLNYDLTTHVVHYTHNVVLFLRDHTTGTIYAFRATAADGKGNASLNRGLYWFDIGVLDNN